MRRFSLFFIASLLISPAQATTPLPSTGAIYIPQPNLVWTTGILAPALSMDGGGISVLTHGGNARNGGSFLGLQGSFPLMRSEEARISGWAWGFAAGVTEYVNEPRSILSPSAYYWELMMGRGTTEPLAGGESGLRGYLEFVLRDQQPQRSSEAENFEYVSKDIKHHFVPNHRWSFGVRMGTGNDLNGKGLVTQHAPRVQFNFQTAAYFALPMNDVKRTYLTLQGRSYIRCGWDWLKCGLGLNYLNSPEAMGSADVAELAHHGAFGPSLQGRWGNRYTLDLDIQWGRMSGYRNATQLKADGSLLTDANDPNKPIYGKFIEHRSSGVPSINLTLMAAF